MNYAFEAAVKCNTERVGAASPLLEKMISQRPLEICGADGATTGVAPCRTRPYRPPVTYWKSTVSSHATEAAATTVQRLGEQRWIGEDFYRVSPFVDAQGRSYLANTAVKMAETTAAAAFSLPTVSLGRSLSGFVGGTRLGLGVARSFEDQARRQDVRFLAALSLTDAASAVVAQLRLVDMDAREMGPAEKTASARRQHGVNAVLSPQEFSDATVWEDFLRRHCVAVGVKDKLDLAQKALCAAQAAVVAAAAAYETALSSAARGLAMLSKEDGKLYPPLRGVIEGASPAADKGVSVETRVALCGLETIANVRRAGAKAAAAAAGAPKQAVEAERIRAMDEATELFPMCSVCHSHVSKVMAAGALRIRGSPASPKDCVSECDENHQVCGDCFYAIVTSSDPESHHGPEGTIFKCPLCRRATSVFSQGVYTYRRAIVESLVDDGFIASRSAAAAIVRDPPVVALHAGFATADVDDGASAAAAAATRNPPKMTSITRARRSKRRGHQ